MPPGWATTWRQPGWATGLGRMLNDGNITDPNNLTSPSTGYEDEADTNFQGSCYIRFKQDGVCTFLNRTRCWD